MLVIVFEICKFLFILRENKNNNLPENGWCEASRWQPWWGVQCEYEVWSVVKWGGWSSWWTRTLVLPYLHQTTTSSHTQLKGYMSRITWLQAPSWNQQPPLCSVFFKARRFHQATLRWGESGNRSDNKRQHRFIMVGVLGWLVCPEGESRWQARLWRSVTNKKHT